MGTYYPSHNYGPEHAASLGRLPQESKPKRPVSDAQLAANRANARRSTGPRTPEGKAVSSQNALRHGLTGQISVHTAEDRAAKEAFSAPIVQDLRPEGPLETQIAQLIADGHWRLNHASAIEDNIFALGHFTPAAEIDVDNAELHAALTSARVFLQSSKDLERLTLYTQRIQRGIEKNMSQLAALQAERRAAEAKALEEAAQITHVARFHSEPVPATITANGFKFSSARVNDHIDRRERLKEAAYHEKHYWQPYSEYPGAARQAA